MNNFKQTELGILPEEWEVVRCIDYCDFERGTEPGSDSYNRYKKGVPFIRVGNISAKIQELVYTTSFKIKLCTEDDILMSFDGSPGVVVKGFRGAYSSGIRKVIPKKFIDKKFLYFVLQSDYVKNIIEKYT
ncbi:MAG: restriction endonuclease subunit S, partial [Methanosarcinales archaeon]